jgi:hypothetical protein
MDQAIVPPTDRWIVPKLIPIARRPAAPTLTLHLRPQPQPVHASLTIPFDIIHYRIIRLLERAAWASSLAERSDGRFEQAGGQAHQVGTHRYGGVERFKREGAIPDGSPSTQELLDAGVTSRGPLSCH